MSAVGAQTEGNLSCNRIQPRAEETSGRRLVRLNFRPVLFMALGCVMGVFLYFRIAFGGFVPSDALFFAVFLPFLLLRRRRAALWAAALFLVCAGLGAGLAHAEARRFGSGVPSGSYSVLGTVQSVAISHGRTSAVLTSLYLDGERVGGKMQVYLASEDIRPSDILSFSAQISRSPLPVNGDAAAESNYAGGVRYEANAGEFVRTGRSADPFLRLNAALYDALYSSMESDAAGIAYALLTGNSRCIDASFLTEARTAGVAHAFAVSGLHIGILYGAAMVLFRPLRRYAMFPALALAGCYCAVCAFSISSVRALIMCAAAGGHRFFGRKNDFLSSVSFAGLATLIAVPAQFLTAGFRLSFGAVLGIALFSGSIRRGLMRLRLPGPVASYLGASLSVQLFTFPVMAETFGYVSVWGTLLNLVVIPALPVLLLPLIACAVLAVAIPSAGAVLLALPNGMITVLLLVFSAADFSAVLTGFSLGAGAAVWFTAMFLLSERVRLRTAVRAAVAGVLCVAFTACMVWQNVVPSGYRVIVYEHGSGTCALIRSSEEAVLVIDDEISLSACEDFLSRNYAGTLDAVAVAGEDAVRAVNVAAFLPAREVRVRVSEETGLRGTRVLGGVRFEYGALSFRYEGGGLVLTAEDVRVGFDFTDRNPPGTDLLVQTGDGDLKYFVKDGIIRQI